MNMRAAEAMVSRAPNPMKIFPIREVSFQVDFSVLAVAAGGGAGGAAVGGVSAAAITRCALGVARSTSLS